MTAAFNPIQPRDRRGRWVEMGATVSWSDWSAAGDKEKTGQVTGTDSSGRFLIDVKGGGQVAKEGRDISVINDIARLDSADPAAVKNADRASAQKFAGKGGTGRGSVSDTEKYAPVDSVAPDMLEPGDTVSVPPVPGTGGEYAKGVVEKVEDRPGGGWVVTSRTPTGSETREYNPGQNIEVSNWADSGGGDTPAPEAPADNIMPAVPGTTGDTVREAIKNKQGIGDLTPDELYWVADKVYEGDFDYVAEQIAAGKLKRPKRGESPWPGA